MPRAMAVVALALLAAGVLGAGEGGCDSATESVCCDSCPTDEPAIFHLSCTSADLTGVVTTGPCQRDAGLSLSRSDRGDDAAWVGNVFVQGQSPGVCHVQLTFATGFSYSTDVTFTTQSGGTCGGPQCECGDILVPTGSGEFTVNNPSDTCVAAVDSGADVVADGEGWDGATSCAAILASNYDQSCSGDSDCTVVTVGYPCVGCGLQCGLDVGAINVGSRAQYMVDVSRTPRSAGPPCNCPPPPPVPYYACCRSGQCKTNNDCVSPGDAAE